MAFVRPCFIFHNTAVPEGYWEPWKGHHRRSRIYPGWVGTMAILGINMSALVRAGVLNYTFQYSTRWHFRPRSDAHYWRSLPFPHHAHSAGMMTTTFIVQGGGGATLSFHAYLNCNTEKCCLKIAQRLHAYGTQMTENPQTRILLHLTGLLTSLLDRPCLSLLRW